MTIYYFSATGNSLKMAMDIASKMKNAEIRKIGLESIDKHPKSKEVGFIFPVYMGAIPNIVREFLMNFPFEKNVYYYAICTYNTYKGSVLPSMSKILKDKGIDLSYGAYLPTVGNCLMEYEVSVSRRIEKLTRAKVASEIIVNNILNKVVNSVPRYYQVSEKLHRHLFNYFFSDAHKKFTLENSCTSCGRCKKICPTHNIRTNEGKPQWGKDCIACHACVHWCPQNAINIGKSKGRLQYHNPDIRVSMLLNC